MFFPLSTAISALVYSSLKYICKNDIYKENQIYDGELKKFIFLPSTTISALV